MTTVEVELEREKTEKIAQVAARGSALARELGQQDPDAVEGFLRHYFRHVDAADIDERSVADLLGLVASHYRAALTRPLNTSTITIRTPSMTADGWTAGGSTVMQIVTDDRPFLVDSITMEVLRQGWSIREVFHPQFIVRRDSDGALTEVVRYREGSADPTTVQESWMHLEILPPARAESAGRLVADLEQGLREVLGLVAEAVEDWSRMISRAQETIDVLAVPSLIAGRDEEAALARELLRWLVDNHFTFFGYREYELVRADAGQDGQVEERYRGVPGTGLGILRPEQDVPSAFHALPQPGTRHDLMIITKDDQKSRIHRPAYLDYLAFRTFDAEGLVRRERRFLGLFASTAYTEQVSRVPLLRQKAVQVLAQSGYDPNSHGGKAIIDALETYPRDELFQATAEHLAAVVERVAHLKERRQVRLFVRRDDYGRYISCLVYLPRDRYTTAVRNRMQTILMRNLAGASIDYSARVTESVLARLHFVIRMPSGEPIGEIDVRGLEKQLTLATRSWNDEFADQLGDQDPGQLATLVGALPEGYKEDYTPRQATMDLGELTELAGSDHTMSLALFVPDRPDDEADLRLKIFRRESSLSLSRILPHLSLLGVSVIDERPYELSLPNGEKAFIYDFGLTVPGGAEAVRQRWTPAARQQFMEAFTASYTGQSESDGFNALVMTADLGWREVSVLRAICRR